MKQYGIAFFLLLFLGIAGCKSNGQAKEESMIKPGKNKIFYLSEGDKISAYLFIPKNYRKGEKRPAIIVSPPASGVKEQTAGLYAEKLA